MNNIFEVATRNKLRFPFKGLISVEDLWDLSVENLDKIYKVLNTQRKQAQEDSLLHTKSKEDEVVELQINIIKHIVAVKQAETAERINQQKKNVERQKIMNILADKKDEALRNMSAEELEKKLDELS